MTALNRHITTLLLLAVFSLMTHAGVYHGPGSVDGHAQEQESGHVDSDTCIAGLAHAQPTFEQPTPSVIWVQEAVLTPFVEGNRHQDAHPIRLGRAPPVINTTITS
jgi:hypothetical protein